MWCIKADWKPGMKDVLGRPLVGKVVLWKGQKKAVEATLSLYNTSSNPFYVQYREEMTNFRIEKF